MVSQCSVCDLQTPKLGKHYGATTCYPCRAFFRRAQTRKRELRCKRAGGCALNGSVKKFCPSCRYDKCLRYVECDMSVSTSPSCCSVGMRPECVLDEEGISQRFKFSKSRGGPSSSASPDPATPLSSESSPGPSSATAAPAPAPMPHLVRKGTVPMSPSSSSSDVQSSIRVSVIKFNPFRSNISHQEITPEREDLSDFDNVKTDDDDEDYENTYPTAEDNDLENLIQTYIHKKFRNKAPSFATDDIGEMKYELDIGSLTSHSSPAAGLTPFSTSIDDIDTKEIEMYFLQDMERIFMSSFRSINLGEDVMNAYMDFCIKKHDLAPQFFSSANLQFREKFLNFIASYDVIDLPSSKLYSVIKKNLATSQALIYVRQFNATTAEEELRLGCGDRDLAQWREREAGIAGVSFSQMVHHVRIENEAKLGLLNCLLQLCMPIMQDLKVVILTFLIAFFDMDSDEEVKKLKEMFISLLQKYFLHNYHKFSNGKQMQNVHRVLNKLQYLSDFVK